MSTDSLRKLISYAGKCMHSIGEGGVNMSSIALGRDADYDVKKLAISKYLFHLAFENTIEAGYVTEKPSHALIAGNTCFLRYYLR